MSTTMASLTWSRAITKAEICRSCYNDEAGVDIIRPSPFFASAAHALRRPLAVEAQDSTVWLVNTGWTGRPYGQGNWIKLAHTRALVRAALSGSLANVPTTPDPVFGVLVPTACPGVPPEILQPKGTWRRPNEYDAKARQLAALFQKNFATYGAQATEGVHQAGPKG